MTVSTKKQLLKHVDKLRGDNKFTEIAELLMSLSGVVKKDYDLSCMLAEAFINIADDDNLSFFESAEIILQNFRKEGSNDPRWHELMARSLYFQNFYYDASRHLQILFKLIPFDSDERKKYSDADALLKSITLHSSWNVKAYNQYEKYTLIDHIEYYFGKIEYIISDSNPLDIRADIAVIPPDYGHEYYTLVTIGMGAAEMNVPPEYRNRIPDRAEILCYLPPDWDVENHPFDKCWQVEQMRTLAHLPSDQNTRIGFGYMNPSGFPFDSDTEMCTSLLIHVQDVEERAGICNIGIRCEKYVCIYQLFPLYIDETKYKIAHGINALIEKMSDVSAVINPQRENMCKDFGSDDATVLVGKEINMLKGIEIGTYCAASRRITADGCKVGYMRRFLFDDDEEDDRNDSGWLMLAGDESPEYLSAPFNLSIYKINTICNIDYEIIPFLTMPYDTEIVRGEDGRLRAVDKDISTETDTNYS